MPVYSEVVVARDASILLRESSDSDTHAVNAYWALRTLLKSITPSDTKLLQSSNILSISSEYCVLLEAKVNPVIPEPENILLVETVVNDDLDGFLNLSVMFLFRLEQLVNILLAIPDEYRLIV